jgi:hypothetical protein
MPTTTQRETNGDLGLLAALKLDQLEPHEQEEMLITLGDLVFKGTLVRIIEEMEESDLDAFEKLMAEGAPEEQILEFIREKVPGADAAVADTIAELSGDILAVTSLI